MKMLKKNRQKVPNKEMLVRKLISRTYFPVIKLRMQQWEDENEKVKRIKAIYQE
jgi:hypothetical protein